MICMLHCLARLHSAVLKSLCGRWPLVAVLLLASAVRPVHAVDDNSATLVWANGDRLAGQLQSIADRAVTWRSPLFAAPLQIDPAAIQSVEFASPTAALPDADTYRIETVSGDVLFGELQSATAAAFQFHSPTHGQFDISREAIRCIQRLRHAGLIYLGPRGLADWTAQNSENPLTHWRESPGGRLSTSRRGAGLFLPIPLPMQSEIEFQVRSTGRCSFALGLRNAFRGLRLETWDDSLVAARSLEFQELQTLQDDDFSLHLTLYVDLAGGSLIACSESGKRLAEFRFSDEARTSSGISFSNRDGDITLEYLRISRWDGTPPPAVTSAASRVQLSDGQTVPGTVARFSRDDESVMVVSGEGSTAVELADISRVFQQPLQTSDELAITTVVTTDGELITGETLRLQGAAAQLDTQWSSTPLTIPVEILRQVRWQRESVAADGGDVLTTRGQQLHGQLVISDTDTSPLGWKPNGGQQAVALTGGGQAVFRRSDVQTNPIDIRTFPHIVHLKNGDAVPCRIESSAENEFTVTSPYFEQHTLPADRVIAIEFAVGELRRQSSFSGDTWQLENAERNATGTAVVLQPNGVVHSPQLMRGDSVSFSVDWSQNKLCVLGIYCTQGVWRGVQPDMLLVLGDGTVSVCNDLQSIPMATVAHGAAASSVADRVQKHRTQDGNSRASFGIRVAGGRLTAMMNGLPIGEKQINADLAACVGFGIRDLGIGVARRATVREGVVSPNSAAAVTVSDFEMTASTASTARWVYSEETRKMALTIPRFRREEPPTHILLAPNGDLLRGQLRGLSPDTIQFQSRLETMSFERDRVAAIICLSSLSEQDDGRAAKEKSVQVRMGNGYALTISPDAAPDGVLQGMSSVLGPCRVQAAEIAELAVGSQTHTAMNSVFSSWVPLAAKEPDWGSTTAEQATAQQTAMIGRDAIAFSLPTLQGDTFTLESHAGRVVILDFWASWCGPCMQALPAYASLAAEQNSSRVVFAAINQQEEASKVRRFLQEQQLDCTTLLDRDALVAQQYGVTGIPHTVIIGPDGKIADVQVGYRNDTVDSVRATVEKLLSQQQTE
jgi:peroxiredoxin